MRRHHSPHDSINLDTTGAMSDPRDYKLDLSSIPAQAPADEPSSQPRPYLMIHFACCGVYRRIYRSADGLRYEGHCPKCARPVKFRVGEGGTEFRAVVVDGRNVRD